MKFRKGIAEHVGGIKYSEIPKPDMEQTDRQELEELVNQKLPL